MYIDLDLHVDRNVNRKSEGGKEIMVLRRRKGITKNEDARRSGSSKEKEGVRMKLAPRRPRPGDPRRGLKKKVRGCESYYFQRRGGSFIKKGGATNTKRRRENLMAPRQLTSTALRLAGGGRKGISVADIVATGREREALRVVVVVHVVGVVPPSHL